MIESTVFSDEIMDYIFGCYTTISS